MKPIVLLNAGAGTLAGMDAGLARERVARAFDAAGAAAEVRLLDGKDMERATREALSSRDHDAVIAGGGDGTLNTVANVLCEGYKPFGVLPLGTHNHFAKDLGVPLDLEEAIAAVATGRVIELPVAEVNGRIFLNFSAIGLHPEVVRDREEQREETGRSKWPAMFVAVARQLKDLRVQKVTLSARGQTIATRTPSVIICNNPHQMRVFGVEEASVPDRGLLNVYVTTTPRRRKLLGLMVRAAVGRIDRRTPSVGAVALPEIRIDSRRGHLAVSIDGEVMDMKPPLRYRIRPKPLRVLVPAAGERT